MARQISSNEGSGGKLVDTWIYEFPALEGTTVAPKKVEVELRLIKRFNDSVAPPLATGEVHFWLRCKEAGINMKGSDIEALRTAVWEKLDDKYRTKWETYFLVTIKPESVYEGIGTGFTFGWTWVEKGTAWDGSILLREEPRYGATKITPWPGEFRDKNGKVMACIPDTPENSKALREFRDRIDQLRVTLADFLRPDNIVQTLANLSGNPLLPALPEGSTNNEEEDGD